MYKIENFANGLKVVSLPMKDRDSVSLGIWFNVGGRYEQSRIKGAAHFLEHIVFKGSKKYRCEEIKQLIEGVGGSLNAFTAEEQTCYYAKIPTRQLNGTFDVLADMAFFPNIKSADVQKEKTVIIEEIKMYHDLPQYYVIDLLDRLMWPGHPLGENLAGSIESVTNISSNDLKAFHQTFYGPANAAIVACGNVSHDQLVSLAKAKLKGLKAADRQKFIPASNQQVKPGANLFKKDIEQMHVALGMFGYNQHQKERYVLSLLSVILGGNMSSRLFVEVREKHGLAYSISSYSKSMADTGAFMVRAGVDNNRLLQALELILKELEKITKKDVPGSEFNRARDYVLGQLLLGLEDTMEHMLWMGESMMAREKLRTMKEVVQDFKKITPADVRRIARDVISPEKFNMALVGPITEEQCKKINALMGVS